MSEEIRTYQDQLEFSSRQLRAENERLREAFREIVKVSSKYKVEGDEDGNNNYWEWEDNGLDVLLEIDKIVGKALNEVTKCHECGGSCSAEIMIDGGMQDIPCPYCNGSGEVTK